MELFPLGALDFPEGFSGSIPGEFLGQGSHEFLVMRGAPVTESPLESVFHGDDIAGLAEDEGNHDPVIGGSHGTIFPEDSFESCLLPFPGFGGIPFGVFQSVGTVNSSDAKLRFSVEMRPPRSISSELNPTVTPYWIARSPRGRGWIVNLCFAGISSTRVISSSFTVTTVPAGMVCRATARLSRGSISKTLDIPQQDITPDHGQRDFPEFFLASCRCRVHCHRP